MRHTFWPIIRSTAFSNNIVLVKAVGLCPLIAGGINLKYGVALTLCTLAVLLPSCLFMAGMGDRLPKWLHPPVYTLTATAMMVGAAAVISRFIDPALYASLYLYMPLMVVSTIFTYHAGGFSAGTKPLLAAADAIGSSLGFGLVICLVSSIREIAVNGTLWDIPLPIEKRFVSGSLPFAAFIMIAFMAAAVQAHKNRRMRETQEVDVL